jgi:hypothetical protein
MSRNSTQHVCLYGVAAAILLCGGAAAQGPGPDADPDVTVYVENDAFSSRGAVMATAKKTATAMFAEIGVRVAWAVEGAGNGAATGVVLRVHIVDRAPRGIRWAAMAYAHPFANGTKAITVVWERVQPVDRFLPGVAPAVLAHVMVHEITHVLQITDCHSPTGIMKARWTLDDFKKMYGKPLPFTGLDARLVQAGLARLRGLTGVDADPH